MASCCSEAFSTVWPQPHPLSPLAFNELMIPLLSPPSPCLSPLPSLGAFSFLFLSPTKFFLGPIKMVIIKITPNITQVLSHISSSYSFLAFHSSSTTQYQQSPNVHSHPWLPQSSVLTSRCLLDLSSWMFFKLSVSKTVLTSAQSSMPTTSSYNTVVPGTHAAAILYELTRTSDRGKKRRDRH